MKKLFILFALILASPTFAQITVEGTISDANGKPPILAHAHIGKYNEDAKKSTSTECSKEGHFSVKIAKAGIYALRLSAVDHEEISIPLILDEKDKHIEVNVRLRANAFIKDPDKITVIGDWNKFAFASSEQMTPVRANDMLSYYTYERTATGDTMSYQLMGTTTAGHSVNGTMADYFTYDGGGDYRSVIRTKPGQKVTITFDPSKEHYNTDADLPKVEIKNNQYLKKAYELSVAVEKMERESTVIPPGGGAATIPADKYKAILDNLKRIYADALKSGDIKFSQFAAVMLAKEFNPTYEFGSDNAEIVVKAVPATSPLWVMAPYEIRAIAGLVDKKTGDAYLKEFKNSPERSIRAIAYADDMEQAVKAKDTKEWRRLYELIKKDYGDVPEIKWTMVENNPDAVVMTGKPIPDFEVALLDGSGKVSNTSMLGKYYMIDFWATWCGPCVREMPAIHKAYEKFKGRKGFEILSLSMDAAESQIAPFRAKKWKMPWLHAFIPGVFEAELAKKFEVLGIPKPILVGPDGKVVAMQEELRGEELEKTLGKFLGQTD
ncbi:MAG: thioredoxin-like domain-containing protein [Bacteroidota bacterium]|nr:thioredoxin-like domain-containing protein [Bacteroidota bacterium]